MPNLVLCLFLVLVLCIASDDLRLLVLDSTRYSASLGWFAQFIEHA